MDQLLVKRILLIAGGILVLIAAFTAVHGAWSVNDAGHYQVRQELVSGELSVRDEPGMYWRGWGKITTYQLAPVLDFTGNKEGSSGAKGSEGGQADMDLGGNAYYDTPFNVTFQGNSTADVSGVIKVKMPVDPIKRLEIHRLYTNEASVVDTLIRQTVGEAIKLAGPMFTAEEARTTRREEYTSLVLNMLNDGIYQTYTSFQDEKDEEGNTHTVAVTKLKLDENGAPIVIKPSPLKLYGVTVVQFSIRGLDFDDVTQKLMMAKKEAEQNKVVARAKAETAKQDAITAQQEGLARVAKETADENVKKVDIVVSAQAQFESAQFARKQAEQEAAAKIAQGEAEAKVSKLKVQAGLSPLERANIEKETAIGVAHELAQTQFPASVIVVSGGQGGKGGGLDPFTALGLNSMYDLTKRMESENLRKARASKADAEGDEKDAKDAK